MQTYHLSHFTPGLPIRPLSCLGSEPPETAMVNRPFFWTASFCAFMMNWARDSTSSSGFENEQRMGADGACTVPTMAREQRRGERCVGFWEGVRLRERSVREDYGKCERLYSARADP